MDRRKLLLLAVAVIVAIGAALAARSLFAEAATPQVAARTQEGPRVLVAQRALPAGTIITADAIAFQPWPSDLVRSAYYLAGEADQTKLLGNVVRFPMTAGEPVTRGALVAPGERGFLAAALDPGMRAVTVPVSANTGVGGFILPGDRVDVVLTQTIEGRDNLALSTSETIVRNLRVLATGQFTDNPTLKGEAVAREVKTVTLEVTPRVAEMIAVAQEVGTLTLTLRSLADSDPGLEPTAAADEGNGPDNLQPAQGGAQDRTSERLVENGRTFVTGGDVSRFQRRTLPPRGEPPSASAPAPSPPMPAPVVVPPPRPASAVTVEVATPARSGPVVRVTRGKETVVVPVGRE